MNLTIYLLRDTVTSFDHVIPQHHREGATPYVRVAPAKKVAFECETWVQANKPKTPGWTKFLAPVFDVKKLGLENQTCSAVLLLKVDKRIFAVTFGHGFSAIDRSLVEPSFG
ncbi:MAG: DUF6119 family protein, partial [Myxococcota bacterium]